MTINKSDILENNPYIIEIEGHLINTQQTKDIVFEDNQVTIYYIDGSVKTFTIQEIGVNPLEDIEPESNNSTDNPDTLT